MNIGLSDKQIIWMFFSLVLLTIGYFVVAGLVSDVKGVNDKIIDRSEKSIMESRLLYSPKCFAYQDSSSGRTYSGWIDMSKFTMSVINNCVGYTSATEPVIIAELVYVDSSGNNVNTKINTVNQDIKTAPGKITTNSYPVFIANVGAGALIFTHRE